jgi:hypothetical protein
MSKVFTVRLNGYPVKEFSDELLAKRFMIDIQIQQQEKIKQMAYIDEAVLKSDLSDANLVIKHIMEMKHGI